MDLGLAAPALDLQALDPQAVNQQAMHELQSLRKFHNSLCDLASATAVYSTLLESHNEMLNQHLIEARSGGRGPLDANAQELSTDISEFLTALGPTTLQVGSADFSVCKPAARHPLPVLETVTMTQQAATVDAPTAGVVPIPKFGASSNHVRASDGAGSRCSTQELSGRSSGSCSASCDDSSGGTQVAHHTEPSMNPGIARARLGPAPEFKFTRHDLQSGGSESISL